MVLSDLWRRLLQGHSDIIMQIAKLNLADGFWCFKSAVFANAHLVSENAIRMPPKDTSLLGLPRSSLANGNGRSAAWGLKRILKSTS